MARHYKKWEEHSSRWQREQSRKGLDSKRWNGWLRLSESTRKASDPRKYAAGQGVAAQRRERKEQQAILRLTSMSKRVGRSSLIRRNVQRMTDSDLDWTLKRSDKAIRARAGQKRAHGYAMNPWWYN